MTQSKKPVPLQPPATGLAGERNGGAADPSDAYLGALTKFEAALAAGSPLPPHFEAELVAKLSEPEIERLARARACLAQLYWLQSTRHRSGAGDEIGRRQGVGGDSGLVDSDSTLSVEYGDEPGKEAVAGAVAKGEIVGTRIGRFEIEREIGHGGYGVVFLARDPMLGRRVALKVPRPDILLTPAKKRRFLGEGKAAALLNHPNLLTVLDAGETGPICWLVQTYCPGESLATWIRRVKGPTDCRLAARIVADLAEGVEHAHSRGVLHRDIKPSNVMLDPCVEQGDGGDRGEGGATSDKGAIGSNSDVLPFTPKLTDFGLAKLVEGGLEHTATGMALGTPAYMSPEQATGQGDRIGPASDVYGLGAILYELLTGRVVFRGETHLETLRKVTQEEPESPRRIVPRVSRDLEAICLKCLEKDPRRRYASARGLSEDLRRYLRGEPTQARPLAGYERIGKWARRAPMAAALVLVSTVAVALILGLSLWGNARLSRLLRDAEQARSESDRHARHLRQRVYAGDMRLVSQAWEHGHIARGRELLARYEPQPGVSDPRGFEWWYLWRLFHRGSQVITEHPGGANAVASAPGNRTVATGGSDGFVKLLSATGQLLHEFVDPVPIKVNHLALTSDGRLLAAAYEDGTVRIWRTAAWEQIPGPMRHEGWVAAVALSPDGTLLASAGEDRIIKLWSTVDGSRAGELKGHADTVRALAFHPRMGFLVSAAEDSTVRVWDVATGKADSRLPGGMLPNSSGTWIRTLAFEQDGSGLCGGTPSGDLLQWDFREGKYGQVLPTFTESSEPRRIATLSESRMAIGRADSQIRLTWASESRRRPGSFLRGHLDRIEDLVAGTDPDEVLSASRDGTVRSWKMDHSLGNVSVSNGPRVAPRLIWRDDWLVVASGLNGPMLILEMPGGRVIREIPTSVVVGVDSHPATDHLVYGDSDGQFHSVEVSTGKTRFETTYPSGLGSISISPDGRLIAVETGEAVLIVESASGSTRREIPKHGKHSPARWLAEQNRLVVGGDDGKLRVWDADLGTLLFEHPAHEGRINAITTSSDRKMLATGAIDRTVKVWSTRDWRLRMSMTSDREHHDFLLLGNTPRLAIWDHESGAEIFDCDNGEQVLRVPDRGLRTGECVSPAGDMIVELIVGRLYVLDGRACKD